MVIKWLKDNLPNPEKLLDTENHKPGFLSQHTGRFVFTLCLKGVSNPLDAKALWTKHGGDDGIYHTDSNDKDSRLWAALNNHRNAVKSYDEEYDEVILDHRVFSDVVIWIPQTVWKNDDKEGGAHLSVMVGQLEAIHRKDFKDQLLNERDPHYCIMPRSDLADDEVVCQFGLSVFIPGKDDQPLADISIMHGGVGHPLSDWLFWENNRRVKRSAGWYKGQDFFQIAPHYKDSCFTPPKWFAHGKGYLQINLQGELFDESDDQASQQTSGSHNWHQLFADGEYVREGVVDDRWSEFVFTFYNAESPKDDQLAVKIIPDNVVNEVLDQTFGSDATPADRTRGLTMIFQPTPMPQAMHQLLLKAIALPRFDTGLLAGQFDRWQLRFDCQGKAIAWDDSASDNIAFTGYAKQSGLWYQRVEDDAMQSVTLPQDLACGTQTFRLKPTPLAAYYHAFMELPLPIAYPLGEQGGVIGRERSVKSTRQAIALDGLDQAESLILSNGQAHALSINYMGLSAEQLELERRKDVVYVRQKSQKVPFYILDQSLQIKQTLDCVGKGRNLEGEVRLGEYLLVGYYLLQFHRQEFDQ